MMNKKTAEKTILLMLVVSLSYSLIPPLVFAQEPEPRIPKLGPLLGPGDTDPYVAAYQEQEYGNWPESSSTTLRARITVSFPNTPPPGRTIQDVIPADNYIAGGMFLQSQDDEVDNTDYGWVASLSLDHDGVLQYNMAFYETYEGDWWPPWQAIGQQYWIRWQKAVVLSGVDPSTPVTLTMRWGGPWEQYVYWEYTINGVTYLAGTYNAYAYRSTMQRCFHIGVHYDWFKWIFFYQFGIYSESIITDTGWTVRLQNPMYYTADGRWKYVREAKSVQGSGSYLDNWWSWGGDAYTDGETSGAWVRYYGTNGEGGLSEGFALEFYFASGLLPSGWTLWNNPQTEPEPPAKPYGNTYVYRGFAWQYSTVTLDPNDENVNYWFFWGDGTDNLIGPYLSGVTATTSHTWYSTGYFWIYVLAQDSTGLWSWWSPGLQVYVANYTGGGGGGGCVAKGTQITMADGSVKAVEKIKVGDHVLGFDPVTGLYSSEYVLDTYSTKANLIKNINEGMLRLTPTNQPIYIRNSTFEGWLEDPAAIHVGWEIFDAQTQTWVTVYDIAYEEEKTLVYDFTTDGYQTFIANSFLLLDKGHKK